MIIASTWFYIGAWLVGTIGTFRFTFRYFLDDVVGDKEADWTDVGFGVGLGGICALAFWPFIIAVAVVKATVVNTICKGDAEAFRRAIGGESRERKLRRLESEKIERQEHIDRLERELEIGPYAK